MPFLAPAGFIGLPPHIYICGICRHMTLGVRKGGRRPKSLVRILAKIANPIAAYPIFIFRQHQRGPATYTFSGFVEICRATRGRGPAPKVPGPNFS